MTNPNAIAAGPVAGGAPTEDIERGVYSVAWVERILDEHAALLAACEMMLANGWNEISDETLENMASGSRNSTKREDFLAVLAMRAAVQRAKGERT